MDLRKLLLPASLLYGVGTIVDRIRKRAIRYHSSLPVISIGNISVGGTGKTPLVIYLLQKLQDEMPVIVLSRGYGRKSGDPFVWRAEEELPTPANAGDEPALIARSLKNGAIAVSPKRSKLLKQIEPEYKKTVVLLDDGFQHHKLGRSLDIVLVDHRTAQYPWLLPTGYLRERPAALRRADIILATSSRAEEFARRWKGEQSKLFRVRFTAGSITNWQTQQPLAENHEVILVTGIAQPERVVRSMEALGVKPLRHVIFGDHHVYTEADVQHLLDICRDFHTDIIVTTAKDAVKLQRFTELAGRLYVVDLITHIEGEQQFLESIRHILRRAD